MNLGTTARQSKSKMCGQDFAAEPHAQPWHYLVNIAFLVFFHYPPPSSSAGQTRKGKGNRSGEWSAQGPYYLFSSFSDIYTLLALSSNHPSALSPAQRRSSSSSRPSYLRHLYSRSYCTNPQARACDQVVRTTAPNLPPTTHNLSRETGTILVRGPCWNVLRPT
jgi:hypothetical protein